MNSDFFLVQKHASSARYESDISLNQIDMGMFMGALQLYKNKSL